MDKCEGLINELSLKFEDGSVLNLMIPRDRVYIGTPNGNKCIVHVDAEKARLLRSKNCNNNSYSCGVNNCGNGECVHKLTDEICPVCGNQLVLVKTTGFIFCSNHESICDYEKGWVE